MLPPDTSSHSSSGANETEPPSTASPAVNETQIYEVSLHGSLREGELLSDLIQAHLNLKSLGAADGPIVELKNHPFAVVVTQDCDVMQDFGIREAASAVVPLPNVLFCETIAADDLRGTVKASGLGSQDWKHLKQNKLERYHYLESVPDELDAARVGLPALGIDFKRYFTLPTEEVYFRISTNETRRRSRLLSPYAQHLRTRFFNYQCRIALPRNHRTD